MPQKESRQKFEQMNTKFKSILVEKLHDLAPKYNLENLRIFSFERRFGYYKSLSAPDVVYALVALLDVGANAKLVVNDEEDDATLQDSGLVGAGWGTKTECGAITETLQARIIANDTRAEWLKQFFLAFDALEK
jgi:CDC45-like protein